MILNSTIAAKVIRRGFELVSSVLCAHAFQYFESEIRRAMERDTMSDTVAIAPPPVRISIEICEFENAATKPMNIVSP